MNKTYKTEMMNNKWGQGKNMTTKSIRGNNKYNRSEMNNGSEELLNKGKLLELL